MAITKIFPLFAEERIKFLNSNTQDEIIDEMSQLSKDVVTDVDGFKRTILEREAIISTGIGQGFAIPHVKNEYVERFFITMGIVREGVEWDAIDNKPVHIIFMIGGPDGKQNEYLSILSKLSLIIKNPLNKEFMLNASDSAEILNFFERF
jgi:PTS system nitrogen regulatory IIA component